MIRFFNPSLTYKKYKSEFDEAYLRVMMNGDLIMRQDVEDFEKKLAEYTGTKYAVALNSGTDALYLALRGLGIGVGDEVIVPSRTFVATAQVVVQLGATPIYLDMDDDWRELVTKYTKAIIPVHIEGNIDYDMELMKRECDERGIWLIEDACQALGATQDGKMAGSFGVAGCFSFYPAKILGAFGDAGGLVTNDETMYYYVKEARNHFKNTSEDWGINSRMDNLQAAFLNVRFKYMDSMLLRREEIANKYTKELKDVVQCPPSVDGRVWQDYIIRTNKRDELYEFLKKEEIETLKNNYPFPVSKLKKAQSYENETLRLPCNENLTDLEVYAVIAAIKRFYA
jgi:dTDP-4-amino-4,6-dideoxygalactose transaminase